MGKRSAHRVLVEKPEGNRSQRRPWLKEEHNIKIAFH
jgi:hypothetical protein